MTKANNPATTYSASWLLRTREGVDAAGTTGWPGDADPRLLGVDTRHAWILVPDFVADGERLARWRGGRR